MLYFKKKYLDYLLLFFLSFLFVSVFCVVSSPFTVDYTGDSSIFMTLGRLFIEGKTPYVDFFDHKGPSIILVEALGQLFAPFRTGVFILEILNLFFVLILINKIASLLLNKMMVIIVILSFLLLLCATISSGNSTEEFSLVPLFISLYIVCKFYFKKCNLTRLDIFIIGLCFSFLFWMRLNNAGAICGIIFFLFVNAMLHKDYKSLGNIILYFLIAQLPLFLLFAIYFSYHAGFYNLMYATFIFNFKYVQPTTAWKHFEVSLLVIAVVIGGTILQYKKKQDKYIFLFTFSILIFNLLTSNIGFVFKHYLTLLMPSFVLGLILILDYLKDVKIKTKVLYISIVSLILVFTIKAIKEIKLVAENKQKYGIYSGFANEMLSKIPDKDKKQVYYYLVDSSFYPIMGINPNYKYFILQEWQGSHDPQIYAEINETMSKTPPLWIMTEKKEKDGWDNNELRNKEFRLILDREYIIFDQNDYFILYQYKDNLKN